MKSEEKKVAKGYVARSQDYKNVFNSLQGQRVLYDLMKNHHVLSTTHVKGDPYESAMKEGERLVVIRILAFLKLNPQKLQQLIEEADRNENQGYF